MTEREPIAVGDRVRVYDSEFIRATAILLDRDMNTKRFKIEVSSCFYWVSEEQCRRLVKKPRRSVFLWIHDSEVDPECWSMAWGSAEAANNQAGARPGRLVEFREVRSKDGSGEVSS